MNNQDFIFAFSFYFYLLYFNIISYAFTHQVIIHNIVAYRYIPADRTTLDNPLLVVSGSVSGTIAFFDVIDSEESQFNGINFCLDNK